MGRYPTAELNILQHNDEGNKKYNFVKSPLALFVIKGHFNWYHFNDLVLPCTLTPLPLSIKIKDFWNYCYLDR